EGSRTRHATLAIEHGMNAALGATLPTARGLPLVVGCLVAALLGMTLRRGRCGMRVGRLWWLVLAVLAGAAAFAAAAEQGSAKDRADLMRTDSEFSDAGQKIGVAAAFAKYAGANAVMLPANENPVTGAGGIRKQFADLPPPG